MTSWMVVFDPTGVLWCFCFTVFSFSVARSRVRFTPSACHSCEKLIVKFFSFNERSCSVSKCGCSGTALSGSPAVVYQSALDRVYVFVVGDDGHLYGNYWPGPNW